MTGWREMSEYMVNVGRCLADIESSIRYIRATEAVSDEQARQHIDVMLNASRKMTRVLQSAAYALDTPSQNTTNQAGS